MSREGGAESGQGGWLEGLAWRGFRVLQTPGLTQSATEDFGEGAPSLDVAVNALACQHRWRCAQSMLHVACCIIVVKCSAVEFAECEHCTVLLSSPGRCGCEARVK